MSENIKYSPERQKDTRLNQINYPEFLNQINFSRSVRYFINQLGFSPSPTINKICSLCLAQKWSELNAYFLNDADARLIREAWNQQFDEQRPLALAKKILPLIIGPRVVDLLCGNGKVGLQLQSMDSNKEIFFVERLCPEYSADRQSLPKFIDFQTVQPNSLPGGPPDTLILSVVLHHERNPQETFTKALELKPRIIIIIENPITLKWGKGFQDTCDHFYQKSLNNLPDLIPNEHRSNTEWLKFIEDTITEHNPNITSEIKIQDPWFNLPGTIQPHCLITVDLKYD